MDGCKLQKNTGIYLVRSYFFTLVALGARLYLLLQGGIDNDLPIVEMEVWHINNLAGLYLQCTFCYA